MEGKPNGEKGNLWCQYELWMAGGHLSVEGRDYTHTVTDVSGALDVERNGGRLANIQGTGCHHNLLGFPRRHGTDRG